MAIFNMKFKMNPMQSGLEGFLMAIHLVILQKHRGVTQEPDLKLCARHLGCEMGAVGCMAGWVLVQGRLKGLKIQKRHAGNMDGIPGFAYKAAAIGENGGKRLEQA
jgi:hypothetical protein